MNWPPYREPIHVTLTRTVLLGLGVGVLSSRLQHQPSAWPLWTAFALWFTFGGHWVELWFLNWARPRIDPARGWQVLVRVAIWLVGGTVLMFGARTTLAWIGAGSLRLPALWLGGPMLVGAELFVHGLARLRGTPSFFDGRL